MKMKMKTEGIRPSLLAACLVVLLASLIGCGSGPDTQTTEATEAAVQDISAEEFLSSTSSEALILDVRTSGEFESGHVARAVHIPYDELEGRLGELGEDPDRTVVVYCESGKRAGRAADVLLAAGFTQVLHLDGDMRGWREAGRPLVTGP